MTDTYETLPATETDLDDEKIGGQSIEDEENADELDIDDPDSEERENDGGIDPIEDETDPDNPGENEEDEEDIINDEDDEPDDEDIPLVDATENRR